MPVGPGKSLPGRWTGWSSYAGTNWKERAGGPHSWHLSSQSGRQGGELDVGGPMWDFFKKSTCQWGETPWERKTEVPPLTGMEGGGGGSQSWDRGGWGRHCHPCHFLPRGSHRWGEGRRRRREEGLHSDYLHVFLVIISIKVHIVTVYVCMYLSSDCIY